MKKIIALLTALLCASILVGCGGMFDKEYISIEDYQYAAQENADDSGKRSVRTYSALKQIIRDMVASGETGGTVVFDTAYEGDATADMASACWEVRTQDALCAYCVDNIAYELTHIVTYDEAKLFISYMQESVNKDRIRKLPYSTGIEALIKNALEEGISELVVLISVSTYNAEDMRRTVSDVYRSNPALAPSEPETSINLFSGTNKQKLYDIHFDYGANPEQLRIMKEKLRSFDPFTDEELAGKTDTELAKTAFDYLIGHCSPCAEGNNSGVYSALFDGSADSQGMALAYVLLCNKLGVDCRIVYGQNSLESHCWNIVEVETKRGHIDVSRGDESCFMCSDEQFWQEYRWDVASYPECSGIQTEELNECADTADAFERSADFTNDTVFNDIKDEL